MSADELTTDYDIAPSPLFGPASDVCQRPLGDRANLCRVGSELACEIEISQERLRHYPPDKTSGSAATSSHQGLYNDPKLNSAFLHAKLALKGGTLAEQKRAEKMEMCGTTPASFTFKNGKAIGVSAAQCRERACPFCGVIRAADYRTKFLRVLEERPRRARFSLLTLTILHRAADELNPQVSLLLKAWQKFSAHKAFKNHVHGWIRAMEITLDEKRKNGWHPHFHVIIENDFWPQQEVFELWSRIIRRLGGAPPNKQGVDVKEIKDRGRGLHEAVGYPLKLNDLTAMPYEQVRTYFRATRNRHLVQASKNWASRAKVLARKAKLEAAQKRLDEGIVRLSWQDVRLAACNPQNPYHDATPSVLDLLWKTNMLSAHETLRIIYATGRAITPT